MSQLPPRPSLSHLRKQAKELLRSLRRENPAATLADAQHAVAREYGFASWPKLKLHVDVLARLPRPVTFQRYTLKAREAVFFSRYEASRAGSATIEPEHVLLGLMQASQGLQGRTFQQMAVSVDAVRAQITPGVPRTQAVPSPARIATGERAQQIFRAAVEEADAMNHQDIGLAHIILGVLRGPDPVASMLADRMGMDLQSVRDRIGPLLDEAPL